MNLLPWRPRGACLGLLLLAGVATSANPSSSFGNNPKKAHELVRQLGSEVYHERERASEQLEKMGLAARSALEQGSNDSDPEIRRRCQELLPSILEIDLKNRVAAFLADKQGTGEHNLPHWKNFRKIAGVDAGARRLFGEMLQGDTLAFLRDCADNADRQGDILDRFTRQMQQRSLQPASGRIRGQVDLAELAAVLFIGGEVKSTPPQAPFLISSMLYQPAARTALADAAVGPAFKKLLLRWMHHQTNESVLLQLCTVVQNLNLREGSDFLVGLIKEKKVRGIFLAQAVISLARMHPRDLRPMLEELLADKTVLGVVQFNQIRGTTQLRDVALAMLVHVTGQSHKDYGFTFLGQNQNLLWSAHYLGFASAEQRELAHKKWQEWAGKNKNRG